MGKTKKRLVIDSGQFEKFDSQLLEIAKNLLTERDVKTRRYYWRQHIIIYQGWDGWNYEKSFLPEDFAEFDLIKSEVEEKVWIKKKERDGKTWKPGYPRYPRTKKEADERWAEIEKWNEDNPDKKLEQDDRAFEIKKEDPKTGALENEYQVKRGGSSLDRRYFRYNCFLLRDQNHIKQFVFQNEHQSDFSRPDIVLFFRGLLYWIIDYDIIDSRNLYVHVTCKRDVTWIYHKQVMSRPGTANIFRSQLTRFRPKRNNDGTIVKNKKGGTVIDYENPFPDHCFSFCSDLRCEKIASPVMQKNHGLQGDSADTYGAWQPEFGVCFADPSTFGALGDDEDPESDNNIRIMGKGRDLLVSFPSSMKMRQFKGGSMSVFPKILFLVSRAHHDKTMGINFLKSGGRTAHASFPSTVGDVAGKGNEEKSKVHFSGYETAFKAWLPKVFNEQPHLIWHSTVQFYFLRKLVTTIELKRLKITYLGAEGRSGNPSYYGNHAFGNDVKKGEAHYFKYRIREMSSAAGITYHFESGDIFFRWELQVQQIIQTKKMWDTIMQSWALNVDNFLSGIGLRDDTVWGNIAHQATRNLIDNSQLYFRKKLKEKILKEKERFIKNLTSRGQILGTSVGWLAAMTAELISACFSNEPEAEERTLDIKQTIIKKDTLKGQLGLYDSKESPTEEQNTARMKSSNDSGAGIPGGDSTEMDRDFGGMKQREMSVEGDTERVSTTHKTIKTTTTKGSAPMMSLGKQTSLAHYYVNTIKMRYDIYEFFNRSISNPFEIRFDYSDQLFNSLENCNHSSPIQSFDRIAFSSLQQLVRRGEIQADINIDFDFSNEYKNAFARGIFFRKHSEFGQNFPVWWPKRAEHASGALASVPNAIPLDSEESNEKYIVEVIKPFENIQTGDDHTNATLMGAWIIVGGGGSFITDSSGKDWFRDFESQIDSKFRHSNWDSTSKWSFKTQDAGGSSGSVSIIIPEIKGSHRFVTYDGQGNRTEGESNDIILKGATLSWEAFPSSVKFTLKVVGDEKTLEERNRMKSKSVPPDSFVPEVPPNVDIPSGGGTEEIPTMEDYFEQMIESTDEFSLDSDISLDGLFEDVTDRMQSAEEYAQEENTNLEEDYLDEEEHKEEEDETQESKQEEDTDEKKEEQTKPDEEDEM